jgi:hypothetical protein
MKPALFVSVVAVSALVMSAPAPAQGQEKKGDFQIKFTDRVPISDTAEVVRRLPGWKLDTIKKEGQEESYDINNESFEVHVPSENNGERPFGLLVYISPGNKGTLPKKDWYAITDRRHMIVVGANNSGNSREAWLRLSLAVDAAENIKKQYKIDPERVYTAGVSGGGFCSAVLNWAYSDVFRGGIYIIRAAYWRAIPAPSEGDNHFWPRASMPPPGKLLGDAKKRSRHVILEGEKDQNRTASNDQFEAMKKDGYLNVTYLEVPGMGHQPPDAEWFEKALEAMDKPSAAPVASAGKSGKSAALPPASKPAVDPAEAASEQMFKKARMYADNKMIDKARALANEVVEQYPKTAAAADARKLLDQIGK